MSLTIAFYGIAQRKIIWTIIFATKQHSVNDMTGGETGHRAICKDFMGGGRGLPLESDQRHNVTETTAASVGRGFVNIFAVG